MAQQSRGREKSLSLQRFDLGGHITPDEPTPRVIGGNNPLASSSSADGDEEKDDEEEDEDESSIQSQYTLDDAASDGSSGSEPDDGGDGPEQAPFLHHSNSSVLMANAFAPPYYNRPPTPLPASPSLTSLLRPTFSTSASRPTTPDSSENDTPNDTESAVAKSARIATTVPRASPKVPTYEYYGFVLYLLSSLAFCESTGGMRVSTANTASNVPPLVLPPLSLSPPAWHPLLPQPLVVPCHPVLSRHVARLHLRCTGLLQYWLPDTTYE